MVFQSNHHCRQLLHQRAGQGDQFAKALRRFVQRIPTSQLGLIEDLVNLVIGNLV